MVAKPRVHEVAAELGIDSKDALHLLKSMGELVKAPSSTIEPSIARKLRAAVQNDLRFSRGKPLPDGIGDAAAARRRPAARPTQAPRVFEIANEQGTDTRAVFNALRALDVHGLTETSQVPQQILGRLRRALGDEQASSQDGGAQDDVSAAVTAPSRETNAHQTTFRLHGQARERFRERLTSLIPEIYGVLIGDSALLEATVVLCSRRDGSRHASHEVCTLDGAAVTQLDPRTIARALSPLRELYASFEAAGQAPPSRYVCIDVSQGIAWTARSLKAAGRRAGAVRADSLDPLKPAWRSPMLAPKAIIMSVSDAADVSRHVGSAIDRPEETFLVTDDLLRLAVDSLTAAPPLTPTPVHINALWVFSRPVIMTLKNRDVRGVRAIWFRQGATMWRLRAYAGRTTEVKLVGEQLSGRIPFVPAWDVQRPEQQILAAIWVLMAQGDVTETRDQPRSGPRETEAVRDHADLRVVDVKPGTSHARYYGRPRTSDGERPAWSVRGHWRRQPYPSLGLDENGRVKTQMIWVATYVKGSSQAAPPPQKVLRAGAGLLQGGDAVR